MPRETERWSYPELPPELVSAFGQVFLSRFDCFPVQHNDGRFSTIKRHLTVASVTAHLRGAITLGAYALDPDSMAHWICLDADTNYQWEGLTQLATFLQSLTVTTYLELSRRGGHLWLFTPPLSGLEARRFGHQLLREHKLEGIELYPKQDVLITGPGSFVRLPFGVHRKSNHIYHFIAPNGQPLAPTIREQIRLLASPSLVPISFVQEVFAKAPIPKPVQQSPPFEPNRDISKMTLSERLRAQISVLSFVSRYVELDERRAGYCPFHDDQVKCFSVNVDAYFLHCFAGCGGGSIIDFWQRWRTKRGQDGSFTETVKELRVLLLTNKEIKRTTRRRRKRK